MVDSEWYYARDGRQIGPVSFEIIQQLASSGQLYATDLLWTEGMDDWRLAGQVEGIVLTGGVSPGTLPPRPPHTASPGQFAGPISGDSQRIAAGVCGILLGSLGIHKFILGMTTPALIMLLVTVLTCGYGGIPMGIIGMIEGIIYLTKSDAEFHQRYVVEQQGWF